MTIQEAQDALERSPSPAAAAITPRLGDRRSVWDLPVVSPIPDEHLMLHTLAVFAHSVEKRCTFSGLPSQVRVVDRLTERVVPHSGRFPHLGPDVLAGQTTCRLVERRHGAIV
jgi:hypothetical protein